MMHGTEKLLLLSSVEQIHNQIHSLLLILFTLKNMLNLKSLMNLHQKDNQVLIKFQDLLVLVLIILFNIMNSELLIDF